MLKSFPVVMLPLEARRLLAVVYPTANEQLMVELINRARANPAAEASRLGIDLNEGLSAGTISTAAKQPLAINPYLTDGARKHSQWMIDNDTFSHTGQGGSAPNDRMTGAGYIFAGVIAVFLLLILLGKKALERNEERHMKHEEVEPGE